MATKIYTKTGDKGQTSLLGGTRVSKDHIRIEGYGTVDELNSWIGLLRDQPIEKETIDSLLEIQDRLFTIGSLLAADAGLKMKIPGIQSEDVPFLENEIDKMNATLPEMKSFILPGGHPVVSYCHIARCVCRRAERIVIRLSLQETVDGLIIIYLNRLSDYLFMLSRKLASYFSATEMAWKPRL
jgi:cob(I)alamin adenosyltransferase